MKNILDFKQMCESSICGEPGFLEKKSESEARSCFPVIAVENTNGFLAYEKKAIVRLLESNCFGLTLDIGHSHAVNDADISFYREYTKKVIHMHAHDAKGTSNHLAFGDGEIDLQERLAWAKQENMRVVLETKTIEALTKTVKCLRGGMI